METIDNNRQLIKDVGNQVVFYITDKHLLFDEMAFRPIGNSTKWHDTDWFVDFWKQIKCPCL